MKENIPTTIIKLPISGTDIVVFNYLTTGENRQIQKALVAHTKVNPSTGEIEPIDGATLFEVQDLAMSFLIKDYDKTVIDDLQVEDGNFLYEKIQEITNNSSLSKDAKKK